MPWKHSAFQVEKRSNFQGSPKCGSWEVARVPVNWYPANELDSKSWKERE